MILTCPNCSTSFTVPDGAIPPSGRKVKCANCGHRWQAMPAAPSAPPAVAQAQPAAARPQHPNKPTMPQPLNPQQMPPPATAADPATPQTATGPAHDDFEEDAAMAAQRMALRRELADEAAPVETAAPSAAPTVDDLDDGLDGDDDLSDDFSSSGFDLDDGEDQDSADDAGLAASAIQDDGDLMSRIKGAATSAGLVEDDLKPKEDVEEVGKKRRLKVPKIPRIPVFKDDRKPMIGWVLFLAFWAAAAFGFLSEEEKIRTAWPPSEIVYDWIDSFSLEEQLKDGVDPNAKSIVDQEETTEALISSHEFDQTGDRTYLVVRGFVRNTGRVAARVPRLKITLFREDTNGQKIVFHEHVFQPTEGIMTRATHVDFEERIANFPSGRFSASIETLKAESETPTEEVAADTDDTEGATP